MSYIKVNIACCSGSLLVSDDAEVTLQDSGVGDPRAQALGHAFLSASGESTFDWETLLHVNSPWVPGSRVSKDSPFKI